MEMHHKPVLYQEILHYLKPVAGGLYVDGTLGAGGHAEGILRASDPDGKLLGLDLDPFAIEIAKERLKQFGHRVHIAQASYTSIKPQLDELGWQFVDGILLDLGISSMQVDTPGRGFSFRFDEKLDMRFSPQAEISAWDLVNELSEKELADVLYKFGEERRSRRIARLIVESRPVDTTIQLAGLVKKIVPAKPGHHPATRTFQALRIAVNQEFESIQSVLPLALSVLNKGGRLAVISFHSLEDRIVKNFFRKESKDCICPSEQIICNCNHKVVIEIKTRKPVMASDTEIKANPRSRSARLRVAEKI